MDDMSYGIYMTLCWSFLLLATVVMFIRQHRRHKRWNEEACADKEATMKAYKQFMDELDHVDALPTSEARATAINDSLGRYFRTVEARHAS